MIAETAQVDSTATLGTGVKVWDLAQVREEAHVGSECIIGRGAYIDHRVKVGARCKIQNFACLYYPAELEDGVFIGPGALLINDKHPRAIDKDTGQLLGADGWKAEGVIVEEGAAIGARAVILPGVRVGRWATVGAGAIVTRDVLPGVTVVGAPAEQRPFVGGWGEPSGFDPVTWEDEA